MRLNEQRSIDWGQRTKSVACRDPVPAFLGFLCRDGNGAAHLQFECRGSYASALHSSASPNPNLNRYQCDSLTHPPTRSNRWKGCSGGQSWLVLVAFLRSFLRIHQPWQPPVNGCWQIYVNGSRGKGVGMWLSDCLCFLPCVAKLFGKKSVSYQITYVYLSGVFYGTCTVDN